MFGFFRKRKKKQVNNVALCLGGGGARGFVHIGAIKAFEEAGIEFNTVVGTSVGSLVGALYCAGVNSDTMIRYADTVKLRDIYNGIIVKPNDASKIGKLVSNLIGTRDISTFKKKFAAVAVDLVAAKQAVLTEGNVANAVSASCAVPILYKPVIIGGKHLCDGGLMNNIPADVCKMLGATHVVTVDVNSSRGSGTDGTGLFDVIKATLSIAVANSSVEGLRLSDVIIAPETAKFSAMSKTGYKEMIQLGYESAKEKISQIKALM